MTQTQTATRPASIGAELWYRFSHRTDSALKYRTSPACVVREARIWTAPHGKKRAVWLSDSLWDETFRNQQPAHKILNLRHTGWFADSFQGSIYQGVVAQIAPRNRQPRWVSGIDFGDGAILLLSDVFDDEREAARNADRSAEIMAEYARDSNELWAKVQTAADELEELKREHSKANQLYRRRPKTSDRLWRAEFAEMRDQLKRLGASIADKRDELEQLQANETKAQTAYDRAFESVI